MNTRERIQRELDQLPPDKQEEVADFIAFLNARYRRAAAGLAGLKTFVGCLKDSPRFSEDPVDTQSNLRNEW